MPTSPHQSIPSRGYLVMVFIFQLNFNVMAYVVELVMMRIAKIIIVAVFGLITISYGIPPAYSQSNTTGGSLGKANKSVSGKIKRKSVKRTKPRNLKRKKTPVRTTRVVNYDGRYSLRLDLVSKPTNSTCHSGQKNIVVSNGKTSGEIFPLLGALIGGSIKNGVMRIYKIRDGMIDKANYTGQIKMPISVGTTGTGQLEGAWTANGGGVCIWRASLRKL